MIIDDTRYLCRVALSSEAHREQRCHWMPRKCSHLAARHLFRKSRASSLLVATSQLYPRLAPSGSCPPGLRGIPSSSVNEAHAAVKMFAMVSPMVKNRVVTSSARGTPPGKAVNDKNDSRKGEQEQHRSGPTLRVPRRSRGGTHQPLNRQEHAHKAQPRSPEYATARPLPNPATLTPAPPR